MIQNLSNMMQYLRIVINMIHLQVNLILTVHSVLLKLIFHFTNITKLLNYIKIIVHFFRVNGSKSESNETSQSRQACRPMLRWR
jgi:predicted KAP-like P-loop ATPase